MMTSSPVSFSLSQRALHWIVAALIFFNLLLPDGMNAWHRTVRHGGTPTPEQISSANIHAYVGIAIFVLAILRVGLRVVQGVPPEPDAQPAVFRLLSKFAHALLYILIFAMPLTGIGGYYLGMEFLSSIHAGLLKAALWTVICAHVAAVLLHHFYWKTNVLRRMTIG